MKVDSVFAVLFLSSFSARVRIEALGAKYAKYSSHRQVVMYTDFTSTLTNVF